MNSIVKHCSFFKNSNKIAVILCDTKQIIDIKTYEDVYEISEKLDKILESVLKIGNNKCIGLLMDQNVYVPSIILSLQKLKCAFTFISPSKLNKFAENQHLQWILSFDATNIENFKKVHEINVEKSKLLSVWKNAIDEETANLFNDIFCVVTTSGTTGKNKTIRIPYYCIESNVTSLGKIFNINSSDIIFWGTPLSFDPSLIEILLALLNGASLVTVPHSTYINPQALFNALFNVAHITFLQMVPSVFLRWNENSIEKILCNNSLKVLALGGEAFPKSLLKFNRHDNLRLFNLYGITELSCWATAHEIQNETLGDDIPIGKCLEETVLKVYDENCIEVNEGEGEIYIGSHTRKCYINHETEDDDLPEFRETGDLVLVNNGKMYFKGRKNKIVKRFGHKVNLTKIEESIFNKCGLVSKCIWSQKYTKILTFIVIKDSHTNYVKERILDKLRNKLLHILPEAEACFPDYFEILQNLPITSHGKVDENELETYYIRSLCNADSDATIIFTNLWCKYLGVSTNNLESLMKYSFFEMGGNSIRILQLIEEFKELTNTDSTDELVAAVFEKKFVDCKIVVARIIPQIKKRMDMCAGAKWKIKRPKLENMKILWKYDLKACVDGSPLIFMDNQNLRIAIGSFSNIFTVLEENGKELFKDVLTGSIESTPTLSSCNKYLYIGCFDGTMHCIDFNENRRVWKFKAGDRIKSSPVLCRDGVVLIFGSYDRFIYSLSSMDGLLFWKTELDGSISSNLISTAYGIFATTTKGLCYCIVEANGEIKWKFNCGSPIFGTPCILSAYRQILVPSVLGVIFCLSAETGEINWKFQSNGNVFSSLVNFEDSVVFGCQDKNVYVLKISPTGYNLVRKCWLGCEISSTPCIYKCRDLIRILAVCNDGTIYLIDFQSLSVLKETTLPAEVFSSPVVYKTKVYVGCRDNNLYCLLPE